jgi:hypothetical protein
VSERLAELRTLHDSRNKLYRDDYLRIGDSLAAMFPRGLELKRAEDFTRFALFVACHGKLLRYAAQFTEGGHGDSLDDEAVYAMLLRYVDDIQSVKVHEERVGEAKTSHSRRIHKVKNKKKR